MIITCPDCATRYDVDDARFSPNGRSVRCAACGESWFVPAPEPIDELSLDDAADDEPSPKSSSGGRMKMRMDDEYARKSEKSGKSKSRSKDDGRRAFADVEIDDLTFDDDEDDALFDAPLSASKKSSRGKDKRRDDEDDADEIGGGWRKGRKFIVRDEDLDRDDREDERGRRGASFKSRRQERHEREERSRRDEKDEYDPYNDREVFEPEILDADWEDVDEDRPRNFGRKIREERRRATALARLEDVRDFDPRVFDEEFFDSLSVTPRELERALRKARRRAEIRDKNRLTPLRAFGWSAWIAAVAGTIYAVVAYREEIVRIAPKTADAYAVVGIDAKPFGLTITDVDHRVAMSTTGATIEITGVLVNDGATSVAAPLLQAEALGPQGELLARWTFSANESDISAAGRVAFSTRAPAPDGVSEVALSFAPTKTAVSGLISGGE